MIDGVYDLHVHCGPEPIPRRYDCAGLAAHLRGSCVRCAVAKSHFYPTTPLIAQSGAENLLGAVTLNHYLGGINPDAVRASLGYPRGAGQLLRVVWMPTLHAAGHIAMQQAHGQQYDIPAEWTGGQISAGSQRLGAIEPIRIFAPRWKDALLRVLALIAESDLTLATGHLTREEVLELVPLAVGMGVRRIILTHPAYHATALTDADLQTLCALPGVYAEQSYGLMLIDDLPLSEIVRAIRLVGPENTILSTDLGQKQTIAPADGMAAYLSLLAESGLTQAALRRMAVENPAYLVGAETETV